MTDTNNEVYNYLANKYGANNITEEKCNGTPNGVYSVKIGKDTLYVNKNTSLKDVNIVVSFGGASGGDSGQVGALMKSNNPPNY